MRASRSKNFSKNYRKALRMNFLEEIRKEAKRILELGQMTHRSFVPELTRPMIKRWNPTRSRRTPPMLASDKAKAGTASGPPQPAVTGPAGRMMMSERHKNIRENQEPRPSGNFRQYDQRGKPSETRLWSFPTWPPKKKPAVFASRPPPALVLALTGRPLANNFARSGSTVHRSNRSSWATISGRDRSEPSAPVYRWMRSRPET